MASYYTVDGDRLTVFKDAHGRWPYTEWFIEWDDEGTAVLVVLSDYWEALNEHQGVFRELRELSNGEGRPAPQMSEVIEMLEDRFHMEGLE